MHDRLTRWPATRRVVMLGRLFDVARNRREQPAPADVVATVGGTSITLARSGRQGAASSRRATSAASSCRRRCTRRAAPPLDEIVGNQLLDQEAKRQGIDRAALIEKEITGEDDAGDRCRHGGLVSGEPGAACRARRSIRCARRFAQLLTQERMQAVREQYLDTLKAKTPVRVMLEPPRQAVAMRGNSPAQGRPTRRWR